MPRTPEVCPAAFCLLSHISNIASRILRIRPLALRYLQPGFGSLPSDSWRLPLVFSTCCLLLVLLITQSSSLISVSAQSATATLSGTVVDQNGAVVANVNVAVISIAQGFQRSTRTKEEGTFVVPLLPPGNYTVKAEQEGFTPAEVRDVVLNVNDQVAITIHMKIGTLSQTVEIVEGGSLINQSPAIGTIVDRQFVSNLPLNGRSFQSLIALTPGTTLTKANGAERGQFTVNGQRANSNYFTIDGASANIGVSANAQPGQSGGGSLPGLSASGGTNSLVSVDALQEFKVLTSTYAPEFGRTPGAQVSIVTRSGTNDFHGTLFEYVRNDVLDANDWFANSRGQKKPALRQNDFGGVLGGPLFLPRFGEGGSAIRSGKNRTFFFFSYEGLRLRLPQSLTSDVPSLASRQAASASIQSLLDAFPLPNGPEKARGFAVFNGSFSNPSTLDATGLRIDHTVNDRLTLFGRYNYAPSSSVQRGGLFSLNTLSSFSTTTQTFTSGATIVLTPKISNDLRVNYSRNTGDGFFEIDSFGGAVVPPDSVFFPPSTSSQNGLFILSISGGTNAQLQSGKNAANLQRQFNIVDGLSMVAGDHQLKFGIDYRRLSPVLNPRNYVQTLQFNGVSGTTGQTPPVGSALSNISQRITVQAQRGPQFLIFNNLSLYAQDTWKVNPRLTLTYGLRYEINPSPTEKNSNDPAVVIGLDNPATITLAPSGTPLYQTTYNNFAPRIGVAYQLSQHQGWETMVRGGFGLFYDLGNGQTTNAFASAFPFTARKVLTNRSFPTSQADAAPPLFSPTSSSVDFIWAFDPKLKLPRTYQWNATVEQSIGANQTFSASYVAAVGHSLLRQDRVTSPNQNVLAVILVTKNTASSDYHALQLQFTRRLSRGLQALASYTWAHSIDISSNDSDQTNSPSERIDPRIDRGSSDFDVRHAFNSAITYNLPNPALDAFSKAVLRNWAVDTIFTARSATPVNVSYLASTTFGSVSLRPDLIQGAPVYLSDPTFEGGRRFNPAAFSIPSSQRQGSLGRNALRGFPVYQVDLAVRRHFNFSERTRLQLKAEFFNLFNHPNFGDPDGGLGFLIGSFLPSTSTFGRSPSMLGRSLGSGGLSGGFNPLYQIGGPRSIQLSFRLQF